MKTRTLAVAFAVSTLAPALAGADVVLEWNAIMVGLVRDQPPPT